MRVTDNYIFNIFNKYETVQMDKNNHWLFLFLDILGSLDGLDSLDSLDSLDILFLLVVCHRV